jgi:photosystem II stability/assembly factor-like uncharacterized protein
MLTFRSSSFRAKLALGVGVAMLAWGGSQALRAAAPYDPALYSGLKWRMLGPFRGGRVDAVTGVPGRANEFYMGAVNGGVWKTVDAGRVWTPVFDGQPIASIGAIAVAASAPDTVYVGSGESTLRDSTGYGNGMYKSTDAGKTWTHIGLDDTQHIAKVAVDPKNPNIVFVAAIGHLYEAHPERGVYRSRDGGRTWSKVLYKNDSAGASDVVIDPANSQVVYASLWNTRRPTWYTYQPTNGPGGGLFKSTDGGTTWNPLTKGLPAACIGKVGIGISASNPSRVYAVIDDFLPEGAPADAVCPASPEAARPAGAGGGGGRGARGGAGAATDAAPAGPPPPPPVPQAGGFYRSDDAGATWTKLSGDNALWGRGWYFEHIAVDPKNADIIYVPNVAVSRSKDGGKTWIALRGSPGGDDYHQAWVSPDDSDTVIVASDQGTVISRNARTEDARDVTWSSWLNQPIAQIYHVSVDYRFPYWVTGAQQDSGSVAVRSRGKFAGISMRDWEPIGAGSESGMTAGDPRHPGIIFGLTGGRFDLDLNVGAGGSGPPVPNETNSVQRLPGESATRSDWTQPLVFSQADPNALYYANQFLFKTVDDARTWTQISSDLTRRDPPVPANLDATAAEDTNRNGKRGVIYAVAPSPVKAPMVWIGTDDGLIQVTTDDGKTWQNVTPPAVNAWSRVTTIEASHTDTNEAYASVDRHQLTDFNPHIYRTRDLGKTWQEITRGLPAGVYVHVVKEDPARRGLLFAGTERGVYVSFDDGDNWQSLQLNLPMTSMRDFEIYGNDLIVATHGRGFWVIDDISPLRQMNDQVAGAAAYLFKPADAIAAIQGGDNGTPTQKDEPQAQNPANGAAIDYYLKTAATGPVTLEILDAAGATLATFSSDAAAGPAGARGGGAGGGGRGGGGGGIPNTSALWRATPEPFSASAGMHRVNWSPGGGGGRGGGGGGRGGRGGGAAPAAGPFTAKLTVNGQTYTQTFNIKPDPRAK